MAKGSHQKTDHEFRDPIHGFIHLSSDELRVVDSAPFQRLRHIRQLALSNFVYPGATHTRFEHSLGVMELAGRVFDVVTKEDNLHEKVRKLFKDELVDDKKAMWRQNLRFAALCHDIGHLPFSHAGEGLLPEGWEEHDSISAALIIREDGMLKVWEKMRGMHPNAQDIAQISVGFDTNIWKPLQALGITPPASDAWMGMLSKIITDEAFGVDRMDYLLRDAYHTGVSNGVFDHRQLIESLRILPNATDSGEGSRELSLGLDRGGLHSAEAMVVARYLMYQQVYYHRTRRIYDFHLRQFLEEWLEGGVFSVDLKKHLRLSDIQVWNGIMQAAEDSNADGHAPARRIVERKHFKLVHEHWPQAREFDALVEDAKKKFGDEFSQGNIVEIHKRLQIPGANTSNDEMPSFPVQLKSGELEPSERVSDILSFKSGYPHSDPHSSDIPKKILRPSYGYVFADGKIAEEVGNWFKKNAGNPGKEKK